MTRFSNDSQRAWASRPEPATEGSIAWAFGALSEAALRCGFRCRHAVRDYERWLTAAGHAPTDRLLLLEKELSQGTLKLVANQERNEFTLIVRHGGFQLRLQLAIAGSGPDLDLVTVVVQRFEGELGRALIWASDSKAWFQELTRKADARRSAPRSAPPPGLSLGGHVEPWFGEASKPVGEC